MRIKRNKDTEPSGKMGESYKAQEKAPRKGVKADDADEYMSKGSMPKGVPNYRGFADQDKAPQGRGNRGPSQADGGPIGYWDKSVEKGDAYEEQCHWGEKDNNESPSMGFKLSGEGAAHLGHFNNEKYLRQGHNDGPKMDMDIRTNAEKGGWSDKYQSLGSEYVPEYKKKKQEEAPSFLGKMGQSFFGGMGNKKKDED